MPNVEIDRLPENFKTEIAKIYADNKPARRAHILGAVARLKAKYGQKIVALRRSYPEKIVDAAEQAIVRIENEHAATLAA
jgi:hypothetical protein